MNKELIAVTGLCVLITGMVLWGMHRVKAETPIGARDGVPVFRTDDSRPVFLTTRGCAQLKTDTMLVLVTCPPTFSISDTFPEPKAWGDKW